MNLLQALRENREREVFASFVSDLDADHPYRELLRKDYPRRALQILLLREEGRRIRCDHLRQQLRREVGLWPRAAVYLLEEDLFYAWAGGDALALYQGDIIWAKERDDHLLLHEMLHSLQQQRCGDLPVGADPALILLQEALTEEWVVRHDVERGIYASARKTLRELLPLQTQEELLLLQGEHLQERMPLWQEWQAKVGEQIYEQ